jgi:hypothetical protein
LEVVVAGVEVHPEFYLEVAIVIMVVVVVVAHVVAQEEK